MREFVLALPLIVGACVASAQPVFMSSYNPALGQAVTTVECDTSGVDAGPAGANQTWNFVLNPIEPPFARTYIHPSLTQSGSYFPNADVAIPYGPGLDYSYLYYRTEIGSLVYLGYGSIEVEYYEDGQIELVYPFAFGESFVDSFSFVQPIIGPVYASGHTNVTYDAFGTLVVNGVAYENVVRIHTIREHSFVGNGTVYHQEVYQWIDPTAPGQVLLSIANRSGLRKVEVVESAVAIPVLTDKKVFSIFPNPSTSVIAVTGLFQNGQVISVQNVLGQTVLSKRVGGETKIHFDISALPEGLYLITLIGHQGVVHSEKLMLYR